MCVYTTSLSDLPKWRGESFAGLESYTLGRGWCSNSGSLVIYWRIHASYSMGFGHVSQCLGCFRIYWRAPFKGSEWFLEGPEIFLRGKAHPFFKYCEFCACMLLEGEQHAHSPWSTMFCPVFYRVTCPTKTLACSLRVFGKVATKTTKTPRKGCTGTEQTDTDNWQRLVDQVHQV